MEFKLSEAEVRILGSLLEKKMATPEYYPLSLNALTNACNQKTNRNPVVAYDEDTVLDAIDGLVQKKLVSQSHVGRVIKYEELLMGTKNMINKEASILCILLVRGPQTIGEIKSRTERQYRFESLEEVGETLQILKEWGFTQKLPRMPGCKEPRYTHLFSDATDDQEQPADNQSPQLDAVPNVDESRIIAIEEEVRLIKDELDALKNQFMEFKKQFE